MADTKLNPNASGPSTELVTFPNPAPDRDYTIRMSPAGIHLPVSRDRPA